MTNAQSNGSWSHALFWSYPLFFFLKFCHPQEADGKHYSLSKWKHPWVPPSASSPAVACARSLLLRVASAPLHPLVSPRGSPGLLAVQKCHSCGRWVALRCVASHSPLRCVEASENQGWTRVNAASPVPALFYSPRATPFRELWGVFSVSGTKMHGFRKKMCQVVWNYF